MAHVTALAAARHSVFARVGWDINELGLIGGPTVQVLVGAERHATIDRALRFLGLGAASIVAVAADGEGRMPKRSKPCPASRLSMCMSNCFISGVPAC
jgi:hypothetical protein